MKNVIGGVLLVAALLVAAAACRAEARMARRVADAQRRLATLHYDADDGIDQAESIWRRVPWLAGTSDADVRRRRATVSYWQSQYDDLNGLTPAGGGQAPSDPQVMLIAANASYRTAMRLPDRRAVVERLDLIIQSYGDVLRHDANALDAAYNYEFVSRQRDALARTSARATAPPRKPAPPAETTGDLPEGPTIHGAPGGPPPGTDMSDFKTLTPMRYDEREEQMDPGLGQKIRRKG